MNYDRSSADTAGTELTRARFPESPFCRHSGKLAGAVIAGGFLALGVVTFSTNPAWAQTCTPGIFDGVDGETCKGVFPVIHRGLVTGDYVVNLQGVTVTDAGVILGTDDVTESTLRLVFDPEIDGGVITHLDSSGASSFDGIQMSSNVGDLILDANTPAGLQLAHRLEAAESGVNMSTGFGGSIALDSALPVTAEGVGYDLRTEAGQIHATVRAPVSAGRNGILAFTEGGDVTINVEHTAADGQPDILFNTGNPTSEGGAGGIVVQDRSGSKGGDALPGAEAVPNNTITVNLWDDVSIIGAYDESQAGNILHAGVQVQSSTAKVGVIMGDNTFIDPVDYGSLAVSLTQGALTKLGTGNRVLVNDLDEDGLAVGLFAYSGAKDNTISYDLSIPHAAAVVTGGANQINVVGNAVIPPDEGETPIVAGIAALAVPFDTEGRVESVVPGEREPTTSSILVSLGAHDAGEGIMAGDQISVVGDGLPSFPSKPSIYGVFARHQGEGPETDPAITIRSDDASEGTPTHIFVGDDGTEGVTGDGSAGVSAQNWGSGETIVDLGAYTHITVVDNNESVDPDNGDRPIRVANSVGVHVAAGYESIGLDGFDGLPGGDISIGIGEYNHIDVTGGYGIAALYNGATETSKAMVTVGTNALVQADNAAVVIGASLFGARGRPTEAYLLNSGSLVSPDKIVVDGDGNERLIPVVYFESGALGHFTNFASGYVGNAVDPGLADPTALAVFANIVPAETKARAIPGTDEALGEIVLNNHGTMVGRVELQQQGVDRAASPSEPGGVDGTINNFSYWYLVGEPVFGVDGTKIINNGGRIQSANVNGGEESKTEFFTVESQQDAHFYNFAKIGEDGPYLPGTISMLDGEANDDTSITAAYDGGNFAKGYAGAIAVDAFLDTEELGDSDRLNLRLFSTGSTAIYVDNINPGFGGWNDTGIQIVRAADAVTECDPYCAAGDSFYLSPESPNFVLIDDGDGGLGVIRDGLNAWALASGVSGQSSRVGLFTTTYSPDRYLMPSLITAAQNAWYDSDSIVQSQIDMLYASGGSGGGGADLSTEHNFLDAGAAAASPNNGIWLRVSGEWTDEDSHVTDGMFTYDTSFDQDTYSILAGADMKFDPNSPFRLGIFGGYVKSNLTFTGYDIDTDYEGGTFGAYAAYGGGGGFFADTTIKADLLDASYEATAGDVKADVTNIGVRANTGYRFNGDMGFIEPVASFAYVHSEIDNMEFGPSTVNFSHGESLRAGAGARFGTAFGGPGGSSTELSLLGRVWNEFEDANTVTIDGPGGTETYTDSISGVFGEAVATAAMTSADGLFSGLLSAGAEFNDDFVSYSAKAGIRRNW